MLDEKEKSMLVLNHAVVKVEDYILQNQGYFPEWYCGITADPRGRLFSGHRVQEVGGLWIYADAGSELLAREAEYLLLLQGCQGGCGGGDRSARYVYAYVITPLTRE